MLGARYLQKRLLSQHHQHRVELILTAKEHIDNNTWPGAYWWKLQIPVYAGLWKEDFEGSNRHRS